MALITIKEFVVEANRRELTCRLSIPDERLQSERPALLLTFYCTAQTKKIFTDAGHYTLDFDLPNRGDIVAMREALLAGRDPFAGFVSDGKAVVDACLARGLGADGNVVVCGVSRGAYCAIRLFADDIRFQAVAGLAPVTDWRVLGEFAAVRDRPEVASLALENWITQFRGRAVFLAIGNSDRRGGTQHCVCA